MKKTIWMFTLTLAGLAAACGSVNEVKDQSRGKHAQLTAQDDEDDGEEDDVDVPLDQVPEAVRKAAVAAVPGLILQEAEMETEDGTLLYSLEGTAGGERVEVEVRASDAKVTEIERGDDEEDD